LVTIGRYGSKPDAAVFSGNRRFRALRARHSALGPRRTVVIMTSPEYRELPKRIDPQDAVEEVDTSLPPASEEGLLQPDKDWFASGG
jgi:hypothetical protein